MTDSLIVNATPWARSSDGSVTIPAATAGNKLVLSSSGGAIVVATGFTTRTTYPGGGTTVDLSWQDKTATGGETSVALTGVGDNCSGMIYECLPGLTFVAAGNPPSGNSTVTDPTLNNHITNQTGVTLPTGDGVLFSSFLAVTNSTYAESGTGTVKWYSHGPTSSAHNSASTGSGSTKAVCRFGVADVDAAHSYPENNAAGVYNAASVWFEGGDHVYAAQVLYSNTSGKLANADPVSPVVAENSLPGTLASNWYLGGAATNANVAAYTDNPWYFPGDTVEFKCDTTGHNAQVEIYRLGPHGYDTMGARHVLGNQTGYLPVTVVTQPAATVDPVHGCSICAWTTNATWDIPADMCPGYYVYNVRLTDSGLTADVCQGSFVIQGNMSGHVVVRPSPTDRAYNPWGATGDHGTDLAGTWTGADLYQDGASGASSDFSKRSTAVSYQCPLATQSARDMSSLFDSEYGLLMFAEHVGIDLGYVDEHWLEFNPTGLNGSASVWALGHHEYMTTNMRGAYANAQAAGVPTLWGSANTAGWRCRRDSADTHFDLLVCYKDSATRDVDPPAIGTGYDPGDSDGTPAVTGSWRDGHPTGTAGNIPNPDQQFEAALTGQRFVWSGPINGAQQIDAAHQGLPCWRHSAAVLALDPGDTFTSGVLDLGFEVDAANGSFGQPANLVTLFSQSFTDSHGSNADGTIYDSTITDTIGWSVFRHRSGAPVLNVGWRGLLSTSRHHGTSTYSLDPVSVDVQNSALCMWADLLGALPATLQAMRPDSDTVLTDPRTGGYASRDAALTAYGLVVPKTNSAAFFAS